MPRIVVEGGGVAACCCARLLGVAAPEPRGSGPALLVNEATQSLLRDVFEDALESPGLFAGLHRIEKRVVAWGRNTEPVVLPHRAVAVPEALLLKRLRVGAAAYEDGGTVEWTIRCSRVAAGALEEQHFGNRVARVYEVCLDDAAAGACLIEAVEHGWLFLVGLGNGDGSLIAVGAAVEELLAESRLVAGSITQLGQPRGEFASHPRMAAQLCGPGWLACGTAAMAFDPLCGEGAGNAAREAILAAAVVRAAKGGEPESELRAHYAARLNAGFLRHLEVCRQFYATGFGSAWWDEQVAAIDAGMDWMRARLPARPAGFRLNGFRLERTAGPVPNLREPETRARGERSTQ